MPSMSGFLDLALHERNRSYCRWTWWEERCGAEGRLLLLEHDYLQRFFRLHHKRFDLHSASCKKARVSFWKAT